MSAADEAYSDFKNSSIVCNMLFFVRSGAPNKDYGVIWWPGEHIYAWSGRVLDSMTGVYFITANTSNVDPNHWHNRYYGLSLRCLAM